jgi:hypothetical protein
MDKRTKQENHEWTLTNGREVEAPEARKMAGLEI